MVNLLMELNMHKKRIDYKHFSNRRIKNTEEGKYERALETIDYIFYINHEITDNKIKYMLFNRVMEPITNVKNIKKLFDMAIKNNSYIWMSKKCAQLCL